MCGARNSNIYYCRANAPRLFNRSSTIFTIHLYQPIISSHFVRCCVCAHINDIHQTWTNFPLDTSEIFFTRPKKALTIRNINDATFFPSLPKCKCVTLGRDEHPSISLFDNIFFPENSSKIVCNFCSLLFCSYDLVLR